MSIRPPALRRAVATLSLLVCLVVVGCSDDAPTAPVSGSGLAELDAVVTAYLLQRNVPGGAMAVASDGRLVIARGYGYADLDRSQPVSPDQLFRVASVSKPITAIAVLKAVEGGMLDLEDEVVDVLAPLLPGGGPADPRVADMTVRHLLNHTAGWTQYGYPADPLHRSKEIAAVFDVPSPPDGETITRWILTQELGFAPGAGWTYTNVGYVMLARIIEARSGLAYEEFVRSRVLAPVGAARARIGGPSRDDRLEGEVEYQSQGSDIWTSIFEGEDGVVAEPAYGGLNIRGLDGSSGWVISAVDLARLAAAVDGETTRADVLTEGMREVMLSNGSVPGAPAYGAGWFLATAEEAAAAGYSALSLADHGGGMPGTSAYLLLREDALVMAVVINANRFDFFERLIVPLLRAVDRVEEWPEVDLFGEFE